MARQVSLWPTTTCWLLDLLVKREYGMEAGSPQRRAI